MNKTFLMLVQCLLIITFNVAKASSIKKDESVIFFPTNAYLHNSTWIVPVHGWIFEQEQNSFWRTQTINSLPTLLGINPTPANQALYQQRSQYFLVDNERGKKIQVELLKQKFSMQKSAANGHFYGELQLPQQLVKQRSSLPLQAVTKSNDSRLFQGEVHFIGPQGISIISDIDDTIKVSNVEDKQALLENTFFKPFQAVAGMSKTYQAWQQQGAVFHYISASPWHLYPALSDFIKTAGFPAGSYNLKHFRVKDESFFNLFSAQADYKKPLIEQLLQRYPQRQFILVGDAGEQDPEIFADIARSYPQQVTHIYIRDLNAEKHADRYQTSFQSIPKPQWTLFQAGSQLPSQLPSASSK